VSAVLYLHISLQELIIFNELIVRKLKTKIIKNK